MNKHLNFLVDCDRGEIRVLNVCVDGCSPCKNLEVALGELCNVYESVKVRSCRRHELREFLSERGINSSPSVLVCDGNVMFWTVGAGSPTKERKRFMMVFEALEQDNVEFVDRGKLKLWDGMGNERVFRGVKV